MANYSSLTNSTSAGLDEEAASHTTTFVVGFGVLMLFLIMGVAASAFLCVTVKKDPYLWATEIDRSGEEEQQCTTSEKAKDAEAVVVECTQF